MTREELEKEAEEKYNERLKQNGIKVKYKNETYIDGYLDSAEPREKRIEELEKKLKNKCVDTDCPIFSINRQNMKRIADFEKENAELDCQKNRNKFCYSCANATERCFRNEISCPCEKYKSYKDENAELKKKNLDTQDAVTMQMYTNNANKEIADRRLNEAKNLIELLLSDNRIMKAQFESEEQANIWFGHIHKAEQFLQE